MPYTEADNALEKAKFHLLRIPNTVFYSTILFSLVQSWDDTIETAGTDGTSLIMNPKFLLDLEPEERVGLLVHEMLHVALNHMTRRGDRHHKLYNIAADHVINLSILEAKNYKLPPGALCDKQYTGLTTEQVYDILYKKAKKEEQSGTGPGLNGLNVPGGDDIKCPQDPDKVEEVSRSVAEIVQRATITAEAVNAMPGAISGEIGIATKAVLDPILPWEILFQNFMSGFAKDDYTWRRPNRRYTDMYLPTPYSETVGCIATAVDASCSVSDDEFAVFVGQHILMQETVKPEKITCITFDTKIREIQDITADTDIITELQFTGRGGTNTSSLMRWISDNEPMITVIFTDGEFSVPPDPGHPILWVIHNNKRFKAPFGDIINIDI